MYFEKKIPADPDEILGLAGQVREEREGRICTNYANIFRHKAETIRVKQVQAGTSRDKQGQAWTINKRAGQQ